MSVWASNPSNLLACARTCEANNEATKDVPINKCLIEKGLAVKKFVFYSKKNTIPLLISILQHFIFWYQMSY